MQIPLCRCHFDLIAKKLFVIDNVEITLAAAKGLLVDLIICCKITPTIHEHDIIKSTIFDDLVTIKSRDQKRAKKRHLVV